jgi:hypothetical protein
MFTNSFEYLWTKRRRRLAAEQAILRKQAAYDAAAAEAEAGFDHEYVRDMFKSADIPLRIQVPFAKEIAASQEELSHLPTDQVFTDTELKQVCNEFGLVFKPARTFGGRLDPGLVPALKEFKRLNLGQLKPDAMGDYCWVLAKPAAFSGLYHPGQVLVFMRVGTRAKTYFLVHQWGRPYGLLTRAMSWLSRLRGVPYFFAVACWLRWVFVNTRDEADRAGGLVISAVVITIATIALHANWPKYSPLGRSGNWLDKRDD